MVHGWSRHLSVTVNHGPVVERRKPAEGRFGGRWDSVLRATGAVGAFSAGGHEPPGTVYCSMFPRRIAPHWLSGGSGSALCIAPTPTVAVVVAVAGNPSQL